MLSLQIVRKEEQQYEVSFTVDSVEDQDFRHRVTTVRTLVKAIDTLDALSASAEMLGDTVRLHCRGEKFSETAPKEKPSIMEWLENALAEDKPSPEDVESFEGLGDK